MSHSVLRFVFVSFAGLLSLAVSVTSLHAARAAEPSSFSERLRAEQSLKQQKEAQLGAIQRDLNAASDKLVGTAAAIQKNETALQALARDIDSLEGQKTTLESKLQSRRGSLATLLEALERLKRTPPEALVVRPGAPLQTAQSAMLLQHLLPAIQQQAGDLKADLETLAAIGSDLKSRQSQALKEREALEQKRGQLSGLLGERKRLYAQTHDDIAEQESRIAHISAQSRTLSDLVERLKKSEPKPPKEQASFLPSLGNVFSGGGGGGGSARLPVSGVVVTAFEQPDDFGAPSQGIRIESSDRAVVVAPMQGVVRFAGTFKNYGNMLILEHEKGWHSLIAGLEKIDTVVGQRVRAGEPLGVLQKSPSGGKPRLYYELRQNGKPVNPAKKFAGLG
jgi:murein hydrolase activator